MKITFVDLNKKLVDKLKKKVPHFKYVCGDIMEEYKKTDNPVIVTASNPQFSMGGGLDAVINANFPDVCAKKAKDGKNERIDKIIFTVTVDDNLKSSKELVRNSLNTIMALGGEDETILLTGLGTAIGGLSIDDFIDVVSDFFPSKAFKGFDKGLKCRGMEFEVGKEYKEKGAKLCNYGFHYCNKLSDVHHYYDKDCRICEIEIKGEVDFGLDKCCSSNIKVTKELSRYEVLMQLSNSNTGNRNTGNSNTGHLNTGNRNTGNSNTGHLNTGNLNTGNRNTGHCNAGDLNTGNRNAGDQNTGNRNAGDQNTGNRNTGHLNTGDCNIGHRNAGDLNTGNRNAGDLNTGNRNAGHLNTGNRNTGHLNTGDLCTLNGPYIIFNKPTSLKREDVLFPNYFRFDLTEWIYPETMTDEEKIANPLYQISNGYLKKYGYQEAWKKSFDSASKYDVEKTLKLPNFDYEVFAEISGITKDMIQLKLK